MGDFEDFPFEPLKLLYGINKTLRQKSLTGLIGVDLALGSFFEVFGVEEGITG